MDTKKNVKRYAITAKREGELRRLAFANQGRNHFDTNEAAFNHLLAVKSNNSVATLDMFDGCGGESLEVRPVECYWHGDAIGIFFDDAAVTA